MDKLVVGILAHVDAGKTTLSEGLLYTCGRLKKLGRVDHQDAFLDTDPMERARGITIFSKQAVLPVDGAELTLLDTPGHADFSSEMERTLQVLDCAILVISGTDGVQGHTHTLWRLLERYGVPTFLFVNKMDLAGADKAALLAGLKAGLDEGCVDFTAPAAERDEAAALCGEDALERYLEDGALDGDTLTALIARRRLFPCWFGSALKLEGVAEFLQGLVAYAPRPRYGPDFAARVFKISRDNQGNRLTWMKLTGGALRVKEALSGRRLDGEGGSAARLLGVQVPDRGRGPGGKRGGRHRPEPHRRRGGPGGGGGRPCPPPWSRCSPTRCSSPRGRIPTPPWASSASWRRRIPSSTSCGTSGCGRSTSSSWGRCSWRFSRRLVGAALRPGDHLRPRRHRLPGDHRRPGGGRGPLRAPAPLCRGSPAAGAAAPGAAAWSWPPPAPRTCWTGTGSG